MVVGLATLVQLLSGVEVVTTRVSGISNPAVIPAFIDPPPPEGLAILVYEEPVGLDTLVYVAPVGFEMLVYAGIH